MTGVDIEIRDLTEADTASWDEFVLRHRHGTPFHSTAWKRTIEESFGYRPVYLFAAGDRGIRAVLPLFLVENWIIGKALISSPFAVYGGILADSEEALRELRAHVVNLGEQLGVEYIELRNRHREQCLSEPNVSLYVAFDQPVVSSESGLLEALPKKTRNVVRKSLKQGFEMRYSVGTLRNFEQLMARNMRRLGTPMF